MADAMKPVLRPRNEGEEIKIKETVFARRERNLKAKAERAQTIALTKKNQKRALKVEKV